MADVDAAMLGLGDCDHVSANLVTRAYHQRGGPDLDLSLSDIDACLPLDLIKDYYGELTSISSLHLQYNQISTLPPKFVSELCNIQTLDLANNKLTRLPDDFGKLEQLVYLDIHKNQLQSLPRSMGKMTCLKYLNIEGNPFAPPLRDFLELEKHRLNGDVKVGRVAQLVVNFLANIPPETSTIGFGDQPLRRRSVTFENDRETGKDSTTQPLIKLDIPAPIIITESEGYSTKSVEPTQSKVELLESDLILGPFMPKTTYKCSERQRQRRRPPVKVVLLSTEDTWNSYKVYGAVMLLIWLAMCPVMMALVFETSAIDQFVQEKGFWASIWKACRPLQVATEKGLNYFQVDNVIKVRGPIPEMLNEYQNVDPFTAMFLAFRKTLAELFRNVVEFGQ